MDDDEWIFDTYRSLQPQSSRSSIASKQRNGSSKIDDTVRPKQLQEKRSVLSGLASVPEDSTFSHNGKEDGRRSQFVGASAFDLSSGINRAQQRPLSDLKSPRSSSSSFADPESPDMNVKTASMELGLRDILEDLYSPDSSDERGNLISPTSPVTDDDNFRTIHPPTSVSKNHVHPATPNHGLATQSEHLGSTAAPEATKLPTNPLTSPERLPETLASVTPQWRATSPNASSISSRKRSSSGPIGFPVHPHITDIQGERRKSTRDSRIRNGIGHKPNSSGGSGLSGVSGAESSVFGDAGGSLLLHNVPESLLQPSTESLYQELYQTLSESIRLLDTVEKHPGFYL
ncbi:hypothetical protein BJ742DRAFT_172228 [Cladochytrium replicatum]|nr:hypothetical protein BJ742DRAFT_172228 [Cladochytrium replicatum]